MNAQTLFNNYIIAGVEASLARVRATEYVVPEADRQQAWQILSFALKVDEAWPVTRELLLELAPKMEMAGFRGEWIPYLEKGIQCARSIGDEAAVAEFELQIGILYRLMSQFEEASRQTITSVEHFAAQNNFHGQARALNQLAWLEQLQHYYEAAEQHVARSLALAATDQQICADAWRIKGMIAIGRRQWQEAADSHRQALKLFQALGDARKVAWSMQNTGYALRELDELDKAKYHLKNAAKTLQQLQDHYHLAIVWMNLANVLVKQGKFQSAYDLLVASQDIFEKHNDLLYQAHVFTNQGIVLLGLNKPLAAQSMFNQASVLYKALNDLIWYINALDGLVMALTAGGQYCEAVQIADQALAILPQIRNSAYYENLLGKLTEHRSKAEPLVSVTA